MEAAARLPLFLFPEGLYKQRTTSQFIFFGINDLTRCPFPQLLSFHVFALLPGGGGVQFFVLGQRENGHAALTPVESTLMKKRG
jgi:hypothetical protein